MGFLLPDLDMLRLTQESTMTEKVAIYEDGVLLGEWPCRATSLRLFAEPADPHDANVRSMAEWGFTLPVGTPIKVGQTFRMRYRDDDALAPIDVIIGDVVDGDTWQTAARCWGTRPKTSTTRFSIVIHRDTDTATPTILSAQSVQVVYDRVTPEETPVRFQNIGRATYQGGTIVGDLTLDIEVGDRFMMEDVPLYPGYEFVCFVREVLPFQPQRREAKFLMDVGSAR